MRILEAFNTENFQSDGKLRIGTNFIFLLLFFSFFFLLPLDVIVVCMYKKIRRNWAKK